MDPKELMKDLQKLVCHEKCMEQERIWLLRGVKDIITYHKLCFREYSDSFEQIVSQVDELAVKNRDLEAKLKTAQKLLYSEKQKVSAAVKERNSFMAQLSTVRDIVQDEKNKFRNETKEKLSFLNNPCDENGVDKMDTILELDSTDYLMSELSYTLDEDDDSSDNLSVRRSQRNKRPPIRFPSDSQLDVSKAKKSRGRQASSAFTANGNDHVIATTTVTVPHGGGPVSATSIIESLPKVAPYHDNRYLPSAPPISLDTDVESDSTSSRPLFACRTNMRLHAWIQKSHIMGEVCTVCSKKMKFSTVAVKCTNCKAIAHMNCKESVPLPCVPVALNTPNVKSSKAGNIADYVPQTLPMVPSLVVHCIREIEARGLSEVGLYRVPGSDKEVKTLKEKLLKARGVVDLKGINDIHVVCGCLKEFLRSLKEPLIPQNKWKDFSRASDVSDSELRKNKLYQLLQKLQQANRDTLGYILLHLQKVAASPNCKMPVSNLSKMFGPSIVGYSKNTPENLLHETNISNKIMAELLLLPTECCEQLISCDNDENQNPELMKTPSNHSLHGFFNSTSSVKTVRKFKFFDTP